MREGWLVTVCLPEHKWTLLPLLAQLFRTLSICVIPHPSTAYHRHPDHCQSCQPRGSVIVAEANLRRGKASLGGVTEVRRRRTAAGKLQPGSVRLA